ncbi:hypothetical protein [Parasitella parasitica]|uniref:Anaphase-promoting complex subunit 4 n=1 Tax=Parasitella parasitica TaxID=35722 RepID=A0A0B7N6U2_9FUNG|nr:hypothetical protein [Parasitella parasitica]
MMTEEEEEAGTSFSFSEQKLLVDDVKFISWCPTTDLVLLVSPTNMLSLYRSGITITRVWSIQHELNYDMTAVTWKPDGKEFALGCDNGAVYRVDIAYYKPVITPCWIPLSDSCRAVMSLVWINYEFKKKQIDIDGFDINAFDLEAALPTLSQEPPEEPKSRMPMFKPKKIKLPVQPQKQSEMQSLLFAADSKGNIQFILNGIYPIASVALLEDFSSKHVDAIEIIPADNVAALHIMTKAHSNAPDFMSYTLDTQILDDRKEEIYSISQVQTQLNYLLQYTQSTLDVVKRHHDAFAEFTMAIARQAANYITNHNGEEDTSAMPEVELFATLATGNVTESLQEFFTDMQPADFRMQTHAMDNEEEESVPTIISRRQVENHQAEYAEDAEEDVAEDDEKVPKETGSKESNLPSLPRFNVYKHSKKLHDGIVRIPSVVETVF